MHQRDYTFSSECSRFLTIVKSLRKKKNAANAEVRKNDPMIRMSKKAANFSHRMYSNQNNYTI